MHIAAYALSLRNEGPVCDDVVTGPVRTVCESLQVQPLSLNTAYGERPDLTEYCLKQSNDPAGVEGYGGNAVPFSCARPKTLVLSTS